MPVPLVIVKMAPLFEQTPPLVKVTGSLEPPPLAATLKTVPKTAVACLVVGHGAGASPAVHRHRVADDRTYTGDAKQDRVVGAAAVGGDIEAGAEDGRCRRVLGDRDRLARLLRRDRLGELRSVVV